MAHASTGKLDVSGFAVENADTPIQTEDFVLRDGFRLVQPYYFDFLCSVRQRWVGQKIIDIFSREFPSLDRAYYQLALADGRLRVENLSGAAVPVGEETPMRDGMKMRHFIHRHEPPVPDTAIQVVHADADVVAVCKPAGVPVHVSGQYRKNTVAGVLQALRPDLAPLLPIHRLDKPVSGLLLFARNPASANRLGKAIQGHLVEKVYIARVAGAFPATPEPMVVDVALAWDPSANHAVAVPGYTPPAAPEAAAAPGAAEAAGAVAADAAAAGAVGAGGDGVAAGPPPRALTPKEIRKAKHLAKAKAKEGQPAVGPAPDARREPRSAVTEFRLLSVAPDGRTSLVECRPRTGRTHQIRVHLQYAGHPIANDLQYGGRYDGPLPARVSAQRMGVYWEGRRREEEARQGLGAAAGPGAAGAEPAAQQQQQEAGKEDAGPAAPEPSSAAKRQRLSEPDAAAEGAAAAAAAEGAAGAACRQYEVPPDQRDALCTNCPHYAPRDYALEPRPLWLHARSYSCQEQGWSYTAALPPWAAEDYAATAPPEDDAAAAQP